jgi:hypothetical protein
VRKIFIILLVPIGLLLLCAWMFSLIAGENLAIYVLNRSDATLDDFTLSSSEFYYNRASVPSQGKFGIPVSAPSRFDLRVSFNARNQRYDTSRPIRLWPIGQYHLTLVIDDQMTLSVKPGFL